MEFTKEQFMRGSYLALYLISLLTIDALSKGRFESHRGPDRASAEPPAARSEYRETAPVMVATGAASQLAVTDDPARPRTRDPLGEEGR